MLLVLVIFNMAKRRRQIQEEEEEEGDVENQLAAPAPVAPAAPAAPAPVAGNVRKPRTLNFIFVRDTCQHCQTQITTSGGLSTHERVCTKRNEAPSVALPEPEYEHVTLEDGATEVHLEPEHHSNDDLDMQDVEASVATFVAATPMTPGRGGKFRCPILEEDVDEVIFNPRQPFPTHKGAAYFFDPFRRKKERKQRTKEKEGSPQ